MVEDKKVQYKDFDFIRRLGQGAYGEVLLAKKKDSSQELAVKVISKQMLERVFIEKEILSRLSHTGVIKLLYSFQDQSNLYMAVELCNSGDFADYLIGNFHKLNLETVKFYAAEIVLIIEYLHAKGIAHRDLKPENILITHDRHLKVIDFGTALFFNTNLVPTQLLDKIKAIREKNQDQLQKEAESNSNDPRERQGTFVGSALYVSPELLETNLSGPEADLWALGCIIYKMFANKTPFTADNEYLIFQLIKEGKYDIPEHMPEEAQDLVKQLLQLNPKDRLGAGEPGSAKDYAALKAHPFFNGIDWDNIFESEAPIRHISLYKGSENCDDLELFKLQQMQIRNDSDEEEESSTTQSTVLGSGKGWGNNDNTPVIQGIVQKKVGWMFYKKRNMILLQSPPRLLYFETDSGVKLGQINLDQGNKIEMTDKSSFTIDGVSKKGKIKKYYFKEMQIPATQWVEKIKKVVEDANK